MKISVAEKKSLLRLHALPGVGAMGARKILNEFGSASSFFQASKKQSTPFLPSVDNKHSQGKSTETPSVPIDYWSPYYEQLAQKEYEFIEAQKIQMFYFQSEEYPFYLKQAADAPILLFGKGHVGLENKKLIAVVGTRKISAHGTEFCKNLIEELAPLDPVIVSGFAIGVDICAQRAAVDMGLQTISCLAHGFKHIYPKAHREDIKPALQRGGFFTEFFSATPALSGHFVSRNRIIAGLSQATIVVESAKKGGSLHTAQLANSYHRSVFSVPGRTTDSSSEGCNDLIKHLKAQMLTSARDLIRAMNWEQHPNLQLNIGGPIRFAPAETDSDLPSPVENYNLSDDNPTTTSKKDFDSERAVLTKEEKQLYELLFKKGVLHVDAMVLAIGWEIKVILPCLMTLELKGMVRSLPGNQYEAI